MVWFAADVRDFADELGTNSPVAVERCLSPVFARSVVIHYVEFMVGGESAVTPIILIFSEN